MKCTVTSLTQCNKNRHKKNTGEELVYIVKLQFEMSLNFC